MAATFSFLLE